MLTSDSAILAETGDSWFNGIRLDLPSGARFEIQMQYGSIGWSVGATLGYCLGSKDRKVVAMIGDGSFQMTAQEISTMIRYGVKPIIFLINNGGYTIEVEIHDGPYNTIKNWNYAGLMEVFSAADGNGRGWQAGTNAELDQAIEAAQDHDGPALIEVAIDRDDCSKTLLAWGAHVAKNNGRPSRCLQ
jgi:TPP-dependent 2-oxoacid decarboxylase